MSECKDSAFSFIHLLSGSFLEMAVWKAPKFEDLTSLELDKIVTAESASGGAETQKFAR